MFNALRTDELLIGVGRVLRVAAGLERQPDGYERSQLLSAYSITRLLAAEQAVALDLFAELRARLLQVLDAQSPSLPSVERARAAVASARVATDASPEIAELLVELPRESRLKREIHSVLAQIVDAEIAALAAAPR